MYAMNEYFADFNKSSVDQATKLANATFSRHGATVQPEHRGREERVRSQHQESEGSVGNHRHPSLVAFRTKVTQSGVENVLSYSREAYEVVSGTQAEVSEVVEAGMATLNKNLASVVDKAVKSAAGRFRRRGHRAEVDDGRHQRRNQQPDQGHAPGRRLHQRQASVGRLQGRQFRRP